MTAQIPQTAPPPPQPPPAYGPPPPKKRSSSKIIIGIVLGCGALCLILAVIGVVAGGIFLKWLTEVPENVNANLDAPLQVRQGEPFPIKVTVENLAPEAQLLDSIDITTAYLEGIGIRGANPPFSESYPLLFGDYQSYTFLQKIPAGGSLVIEFDAIGLKSGNFSGEIDICIGDGGTCLTFITRTVVQE